MRPSRASALLAALSTFLAGGVALSLPSHAATAVFGNGTPALTVSAAPSTLACADCAGEPSVGLNWNTGAGLFMAGTSTYKLAFTGSTATWSDASSLFSLENLDPILATDPTTGTTLAGGDTGACSVMSRTTDDGTSWLPSAPCTGTYDHPTVGWAPSAVTPGTHVWYYCQQGPDEHNCSTSTDGGTTWLPGTTTGLLTCIGIHGHLKGSADGYAYLPGKSCFDATSQLVVGGEYTHDDGATWTEYTIPGATETAFDPAVAVAPNGTLYEAWEDGTSSHPIVAASTDHGTTWGAFSDLASTVNPPLVASSFPTLVAGDSGRLAYSYLGTAVGSGNPNAPGYHGVWYLYTSYSYDGGQTWTTVKDTPTPVQYGEIDSGGTGSSLSQRNLLDFMDSALTKDGRVVVGFADGCLADCEAKGATGDLAGAAALSTHMWATVAYQTAGRGLFSQYDVVLPASAPTLTATGSSSGVGLAWTTPTSDGGGTITGYQVSRSTTGGTPTLLTTTPALSYVDTTAVPGTTYTYTVRAVNSAGPGAPSNPATGSAYTTPGTPTLSVTASGQDARLTWSAPSDGGSAITGYQVRRATASGAEQPLATTTGTTLTDTGLAVGQTYYYDVVATNAAGAGTPSAEVAFSNATAPAAPSITATAATNAVALSWTAPSDGGSPVTGYVVLRGTAPGTESRYATVGAVTSYRDTAVTPGLTYYYALQAVNAVGSSPASAEASATPYTTAGAPTLTATAGRAQVTLSWTVPTNGGTPITGYQIYRGTSAGGEVLVQTISTGTTYVDPGVTGGTTYWYRVAAVTTAGPGALSNETSATPKKG